MASKKAKQKKPKKPSKKNPGGGAMGGYAQPDSLELNLDQSLEDLEDFHFDDLSSLLKTIPGFDDASEFEAIRKNPLAMLNTPSVTVEKVIQLIKMDVASAKVAYVKSDYLRICVGNYSLGKSELGFSSETLFCRYGIILSVRPVNIFFGQEVKVGIPITDIITFKIYNGKKMCVIGITTGSAHAVWIRTALGMEDDPEVVHLRKTENLVPFFGPLLGGKDHAWITLLLPTLSERDCSKLTTLFLDANGKEFVCDFKIMEDKEAHEFVISTNIFKTQ